MLFIPAEDAQVDWHVGDESDRQHGGETCTGNESEGHRVAREPSGGDEGSGHSRGHQDRIDDGEAAVDELLGPYLSGMIEPPQDRVHDGSGGELAAGEHPGEDDSDERSRVHRSRSLRGRALPWWLLG